MSLNSSKAPAARPHGHREARAGVRDPHGHREAPADVDGLRAGRDAARVDPDGAFAAGACTDPRPGGPVGGRRRRVRTAVPGWARARARAVVPGRSWARTALADRARGAWDRRPALAGDAGMATAEYAIATVAAAGFAGLLVLVLRSDEVRELLAGIIRAALSL